MPATIVSGEQLTKALRGSQSMVLHSGCAEPSWITRELARNAAELRGMRVFTFMPMGVTPYADKPASSHLTVTTFFPGKGLRRALNEGRATPMRMPLSQIPRLFESGEVRADVLAIQVSPADDAGNVSLGIAVDYMPAVLATCPLVIAQINPKMPRTQGLSSLPLSAIDYVVEFDCELQDIASVPGDDVDTQVARNVASLLSDGAVLQVGIGSMPDCVLRQLDHLRHLGLHTGIITDPAMDLIRSGVVDNSRNTFLPGVTVTTMAGGTAALYAFVDENPEVQFHPCTTTHDVSVLASIDRLTAINGALQVDLQGNVNSEEIGGKQISMPGGLPDFSKGASIAKNGASIIAIRSMAAGCSTIVHSLANDAPRTIRADVIDYVVTEHGIASIRGLGPRERAKALAAIAHPSVRDSLTWLARQL